LREGQDGLATLTEEFPIAFGESRFAIAELRAAGFRAAELLPVPLTPERFQEAPDAALWAEFDDGLTNIICVGRIAPHKGQHDLVEAFYHYLCMDGKARLILCGGSEPQDSYLRLVKNRIEQLGIGPRVHLMSGINDAQLHALYRSADLFWSMSEHEGACLPMLDAFCFDVPVLCYRAQAVPDCLGEAGMIFDDKSDLRRVAALAKRMAHDAELREIVKTAQARRRLDYMPENLTAPVAALAQRLVPLAVA
jgi:glycosyltransferase involved in cell wall biosynthesis